MDPLKTSPIPCKCPECAAVITACFSCTAKKMSAKVIKDYGPMMGQMLLAKLQSYLADLAKESP